MPLDSLQSSLNHYCDSTGTPLSTFYVEVNTIFIWLYVQCQRATLHSIFRVSTWQQVVKMAPQPRRRPPKGPQRTGTTSHTDQKCCTRLMNIKRVMLNRCECQAFKRPCTGSCPSTNCCNTGRQNLSRGMQQAGTNQTCMTNLRQNPPNNPPEDDRRPHNLLSVFLP